MTTTTRPSGPAPSLRERKKLDTRKRIADAAWELFEAQGYDATTLTQVAERADVSPRTLFHYFPAKDALVHPDLDEVLDRLAAGFAERPRNEPLLAALLAAAESAMAGAGIDPERTARSLTVMALAGPRAVAHLQERVAWAVEAMIVAREGDAPLVREQARLAASVTGAIIAMSTEQTLDPDHPGDFADQARRCLAALREMVGPAGA